MVLAMVVVPIVPFSRLEETRKPPSARSGEAGAFVPGPGWEEANDFAIALAQQLGDGEGHGEIFHLQSVQVDALQGEHPLFQVEHGGGPVG